MSYYDDIIFLDCAEYPEYLSSVNIKPYKELHWEITMHTRGNLILRRESGKNICFSEPVVFWRSHEQHLYYGSRKNEARGHIYVVASGSRAERCFHHLMQLFPAGYIALGAMQESEARILELMRSIVDTIRWHRDEIHKTVATTHYEALIGELTRIYYQKKRNSPEDNRVQALAERIRANPLQEYDFKRIASVEFGMSYHTFRARFRKTIGKSPQQFFSKCRLHYAIELLNSTTLQVKEIADRCGFENPVSFHNFFKKKAGCSPLEYREHLHLDYLNEL